MKFISRLQICALAGGIMLAHAGTISIQATSITSGNLLVYTGLGDLGGGIGHGSYQLGNCTFDGVRTNCIATGSYVELAGSTNPGATGTFTFRETWLGNGIDPIEARSVSAGSNVLTFSAIPAGAFFELTLSTGAYANFDPGAPDTPNPQGGSLNWQAFVASGSLTCTGGPATCSIGSVGLTNGAVAQSSISPFNMQLTYAPEPGAIGLVCAGLAGLVVRQRSIRRKS